MIDIIKLHEEVFNYLSEWSENARRTDKINPYFYMRSVRDEKFQKGYWFPGDDNTLYISFWSGGDTVSKTPNVFFEISETKGCNMVIMANDSELKYSYFQKLSRNKELNYNGRYEIIPNRKTWILNLSNNWINWQHILMSFIIREKEIIDQFVKDNESFDFEEFVSKFGFITPSEFDIMFTRVLNERDNLKTKEIQRTDSSPLGEILPFALLGFNIENFQGIKNTSINDLKPDARWIYITGENGYGKTTILQAIALGTSGDPEFEKYLDEKSRINLKLAHNKSTVFHVRTKGVYNDIMLFDYGQMVVGYGPVRLNVQSTSSENMVSRSENNVQGLFGDGVILKNINYELFTTNYTELSEFEELLKIIKVVTNGRISKIEINKREVLFFETLSNGDELEAMPLNKLATGFKAIINIVFDIYIRFKRVHKDLKYYDFYGIVLIDELENHLHAILQRELPTTLSKVFPKIQFIVSTHSPIPLLAADKNSIILKVNRTKEEGVTIEKIEIDNVVELTPNILFTSPVFGFSDIINQNLTTDSNLRTEKSWEEMKKTDTLDKELMALYNQRKGEK